MTSLIVIYKYSTHSSITFLLPIFSSGSQEYTFASVSLFHIMQYHAIRALAHLCPSV